MTTFGVGDTVAGCLLLEELKPPGTNRRSGAYGQVWKVQAPTGITCALKLIDPSSRLVREHGLQDPQKLKAWQSSILERESHTHGKLSDSRNVVTIHNAGKDVGTGSFFILMEYMDEGDISSMIGTDGMDPDVAVHIMREVLIALEDIHDDGWIYGDLKPANILRNDKGEIKIGDPGLAIKKDPNAKHVYPGYTKAYAAPELLETAQMVAQATREGRRVEQSKLPGLDERVDVYGVGAVLHQMVTGQLPAEDMSLIGESRPTPRQLNRKVSRNLNKVIIQALSPDPKDRYQSARAMLKALSTGRTEKHLWRRLLAALFVVAVALAAWHYWPREQLPMPQLMQAGYEAVKSGVYMEASNSFHEAYERDRSNVEALFWFGKSLLELGLKEAAQDKVTKGFGAMESAIEKTTVLSEQIARRKQIALYYERIANEWQQSEEWRNAEQHWQHILDIGGKDGEAQAGLKRVPKAF